MPVPTPDQLGPLAAFAGKWEGTDGLDVSYNHETSQIRETAYRETVTLAPFGPVDNGDQVLYGLDYRMAAFKDGEDEPFHTEIGYWMYDADAGQVHRVVMVPRTTAVLSSGAVAADATEFTLTSQHGSGTNGVLENPYLADRAHTSKFEITLSAGDGSWSYDETTTVVLPETDGAMSHTDRNTLKLVESLWG